MAIHVGDAVKVKDLAEIKAQHNIIFTTQLNDYGPGWAYPDMDDLCGNSYEVVAEDLNQKDGDWFCVKDSNGFEWWLLDKWLEEEEITTKYPVAKIKHPCRYHDQPTNIVIENVLLLDNDPSDYWSKNTEDKLISDALNKAAGMLKYRLREWPICGNGGDIELWGYLDRQAKTVTAHWCCSCQNTENEVA